MASERHELEAASSSTATTTRQSRLSWHKHTRFKMQPEGLRPNETSSETDLPGRSQRQQSLKCRASTARFRRALEILATCCALLVLAAHSARSQTTKGSPMAAATTTTTSDEVELLAASTGGPPGRRQSRIYKIRAAPFNGKLGLAGARAHQTGDRMIGRLLPSVGEPANQTDQQQPVAFGLRAASKAPPAAAAAKDAADCHDNQAVSIAASSPTLRLTGNARQQVARPEMPANEPSKLASLQVQESLLEAPSQPSAPGESILSLIDDYDSKITTNRTKAQLSCDSGEMILRLNFSEPFKGIVYPDHNRLSPCRFFGDGHLNYELRLPLRGCGTRQAAPRVFVNDVIVRFHKSLELEEDEVKTLICRYPPPAPIQVGGPPAAKFGSSLEQESLPPFELVDPLSGRPARGQPNLLQEPGSTGNIETLSENLVVAPAQGNFLGVPGLPSDAGRQQEYQPATPSGRLVQPSAGDLLSARNSPASHADQGSFLERLSTIELLFLISTLMFLALLALGLAAGYYFVRRRESGQASAILRRRRRFLGASQQLAASPAAISALHAAHLYPGARHQPAPSSSPDDSDLSARGLLAGQQQRLVAMPPYYINRAYAAQEFSPHRHHLAGQSQRHYAPPGQPVPGRRAEQHLQAAHSMGRRQLKRAKLAAEPTLLQFAQPLPPAAPGKARALPAYTCDESAAGLWRAKSMSCVESESQRQPARLLGGTLSRHDLRGHLFARDRSSATAGRRQLGSARERHVLHELDDQLNNNNNNLRPRLLLKSIEDSYITKVSEICEQEYMKRDSTRPLDLTEWRTLIQQQQQQQQHKGTKTENTSSDDDEQDGNRLPNNLRSLTELDVNFAKTLRKSSSPSSSSQASKQDKTDQLLVQLDDQKRETDGGTTMVKQRPADSPDLILSPEYEHDRLELEQPNASARNSVSYA